MQNEANQPCFPISEEEHRWAKSTMKKMSVEGGGGHWTDVEIFVSPKRTTEF